MSYSFEGNFATKRTALLEVERDSNLPHVVKNLLVEAIGNLPEDYDGRFTFVHAHGHQLTDGPGGGNYEHSTAHIEVEPRHFFRHS